MSETIRIRYLSGKIEKLRPIEDKSDWIDLRSAVDISLKKGESALIPLGVAMKLPEGYEAHIVPRSSTFKNFGILQTNHMGIIDNSYSGDNDEWKMAVRLRIDQGTSTGVDQYDTFLHLLDRLRIDQMERILRQRAVKRNDIALGEQLIQGNIGDIFRTVVFRRREFVIGKDLHAESSADRDEDPADLSRSDDTHGLSVKVESRQVIQ